MQKPFLLKEKVVCSNRVIILNEEGTVTSDVNIS